VSDSSRDVGGREMGQLEKRNEGTAMKIWFVFWLLNLPLAILLLAYLGLLLDLIAYPHHSEE